MVTTRTHLAPRVFSVVALALTLMTASPAAQASCGRARGAEGAPEVPVVFVGIAMGRDPEPAPSGYWPHRFAVEEIESGLEGVSAGDVVEVDLAVNEQFEGGMEMWVEDGFGPAPLVDARYRVGAYASTPPEGGVRYHANACGGGSLERLDDPEGAEPHAQVLSVGETKQVLPAGGTGADFAPLTATGGGDDEDQVPGALTVPAALAVVVVGAALAIRRRPPRVPNS